VIVTALIRGATGGPAALASEIGAAGSSVGEGHADQSALAPNRRRPTPGRACSDEWPLPRAIGISAALPTSLLPAPDTVARLEHAYTLRDELDPAWATRPLALVRREGRPTLLMEDPGGEVLAGLIGRPWEVAAFLRVAIGLAAALGRLRARGLVHKAIRPANVLVNGATGHVSLTGFGITSRLPREPQPPEPREVIPGALAYVAPEQTGRMNRSVDHRSDLYALGVTLYEMLTGALPFAASDPMEWAHCHIARQPLPPADRRTDLSLAVSAIIMKLLAKTAEERYQTAAGLEGDLQRCVADWESHGTIGAFPMGQNDTPDRLLIPEKLYGRASEIEAALAEANGKVSGRSGAAARLSLPASTLEYKIRTLKIRKEQYKVP